MSSALVAAKEYARDNDSTLKTDVETHQSLQRMTGIRHIVFDNLRTKYNAMDPVMQSALRHFVIFPRSFNLPAAASVAGLSTTPFAPMQDMLNSMIHENFVTTLHGRYELNEVARVFLNEDPTVFNDNIASSTYDVAQDRFIKHYQQELMRLRDDKIHKVGWHREDAMALYDSERENMEFSEYLLSGRKVELRTFLSAGITVMRYCVSAVNRERVIEKALSDDEASKEDVFAALGSGGDMSTKSPSGDEREEMTPCDKSHRARLQLALSEAYFDQLKTEDAEAPLLRALGLMGKVSPRCGTPATGIVDSVLILLLLSNLRLKANRIRDARKLCVKALHILAEAGLGKSTFGINAMSNLVTIYLFDGHLERAKSVASKLLDTLNTMRYNGMPIYADALGVCAMVSVSEGNFAEAEQQYGTALQTVGKWGSKEWTGIPMEHCLDLDLWLMEGLAEAIRNQGRVEEAGLLEERAREDRRSRGLPLCSGACADGEIGSDGYKGSTELEKASYIRRQNLRHLY